MHLSQLGKNLKFPLCQKVGCFIHNHSRTTIFTFSLLCNRQHPKSLVGVKILVTPILTILHPSLMCQVYRCNYQHACPLVYFRILCTILVQAKLSLGRHPTTTTTGGKFCRGKCFSLIKTGLRYEINCVTNFPTLLSCTSTYCLSRI